MDGKHQHDLMFHSKGIGILNLHVKDNDWTYIPKDQGVCDGGYLKIISEYFQVLGIGRDMYHPNFDSIRFIYIEHLKWDLKKLIRLIMDNWILVFKMLVSISSVF